jgi:chitin disaccharide deacetylase
MGSAEARRRLIVNADDFGRSHAINQAVLRAHREGILTTASLMVNGEAAAEAVEIAHQNPELGIGLHLTLVCGRSTLPASCIPTLVTPAGDFSDDPVRTGMNYYFRRSLQPQLQAEMVAQVKKFAETGLRMDHLNGHLNLHLHPAVFDILMRQAQSLGLRHLRLTRDPLALDLQLSRGRWGYRLSHALIFGLLSRWAEPRLLRQNIRHTAHVFGLLQTGCISEAYLLKLLPRLPDGDAELYAHPCLDKAKAEAEALLSPRVRRLVQDHSIQLIRYQDL